MRNDPEPLSTVPEAADALRVRRKTVYKWIAERRLPAVRVGRRAVRIPTSAIAALIARNTTPARVDRAA
jgi:excisionase family DNA binding protein